jgi:hypothetical protein
VLSSFLFPVLHASFKRREKRFGCIQGANEIRAISLAVALILIAAVAFTHCLSKWPANHSPVSTDPGFGFALMAKYYGYFWSSASTGSRGVRVFDPSAFSPAGKAGGR